jgi:hypothetical protein
MARRARPRRSRRTKRSCSSSICWRPDSPALTPPPTASPLRGLNRSLAAALALVLAAIAAGCGASAPQLSTRRLAEQRQERIDLALASRELERLERPLEAQVRAARRTWPQLEDGLDGPVPGHARALISLAAARAEAVVIPPIFRAESYALTGPATQLAGLVQDWGAVAVRGWQLVDEAVRGASTPAASSFVRENAGLYIDCVYNGNFDLGLLGKSLLKSYERLGGQAAFGQSLTEAQVDRLAAVYAPAVFDLPHPRETQSD